MNIVKYIGVIGKGELAQVFLAEDETGRQVAVKFFHEDNDNVFNSAKRLGKINHINIIIFHSFEKQVHPQTCISQNAIIMEYCEDAKTLEEILKIKISEEEAFKIGTQLIEAIEIIHNADLGHYDLHDKNILVLPSGDIKVIDLTSNEIDIELIEWEQLEDLCRLLNQLINLLRYSTSQSNRVLRVLSKLQKYQAQEEKDIREIRNIFVKELICSVDGCNAPPIVEVFLYDMYPSDEFEFLQDDFTCPYLCDAHWAENEEKAKSSLSYKHYKARNNQFFELHKLKKETGSWEKRKIKLYRKGMGKGLQGVVWIKKPIKKPRGGVKYPYTNQHIAVGYTKYKIIGKPYYYSGKPKPSYY